ncbi:UNVERIFIED_CONTAM: hypothetical protein Slati_1260200 [Sesamum latifolium]|uniref:SWIM-type domain-containing protein n=1 Tax=Sesamum latifolium TaxID=2727402 RepID=A0AAW2XIZ5_9LAMI
MAAEVGYVGDRTYYTKVGDVYYRVKSDDVLFDICVGIAPEHEISIYVEVDGNVMGSHVDSDFDMKNDEVNPKKTRESIDEETLEKEIEKEVEEMNMKEQHDRNKSDGVGSNEEGEEDLFRSEDDFQSQKGSDEDDTEERHIVFNPVEQYDPTFELDKYIQKFRSDPKRNVKGFRIDVIQDLRVNVSRDQAYRAKRAALKSIEGTPELQYAMMHDYANELLKSNPGSTVVLDKQKGLVQAFETVFPTSDHRFCVRHLHSNMKNAGYRGLAFKNCLWKAARATTLNEFRNCMAQMALLDKTAAEWFEDKPPTQWSRSHFKTDIKEYLMRRLQENRDRANLKWNGVLCPRIAQTVEKNIEKSADCIPIKADSSHWQLNCFDGSQHSVDLDKRSCSCRKWDLNGIPCKHACSAILCKGDDPIDYVNECYTVAVYKSVYKTGDEVVLKQKKRGRGKPQNRLKRVQTTVKCSNCGQEKHNARRCPLKKSNTMPEDVQTDTQLTDAFSQVMEEIKQTDYHANKKLKVVNESSDNGGNKTDILEGDNSGGIQEQFSVSAVPHASQESTFSVICDNPASTKPAPKPETTKAAPFKPPRYKKAAHKQPWLPSFKTSTPQQQTTTPTFTAPSTTNLQPPCPKVNIRAPPRWTGRQEVFPKLPLHPETKSLLSTCTVLEKDGKKYVTLSRLNDVLSQAKDKGEKSKKKDRRNAPFV